MALSTPPHPPERAHRSLGWRLVLATLLFCVVFTLAAISVLGASALDGQRRTMDDELAQIEQIYSDTLTKAIWELDRDALQAHLDSALHVPAVGRIEVQVTLTANTPQVLERARPGWVAADNAPVRRSALVYEPYPGGRETVGTLVLYGDEGLLRQRLRERLTDIVLAQTLQSLLLAGLIMLMFHRMVTVHVRRIAAHLAGLGPTRLDRHLQLQRLHNPQDELAQLVTGVNHLQDTLATHLAQQHRYEQELAQHRDHLAQLVQERTAELQAANAQLQSLARTDALTHLPNRRHFDEAKATEFRRALRTGHPLALLICDIDHFKAYNDHYGHAAGDDCLVRVAQALRGAAARAGDLVARLGGEEFGVLLPHTRGAAAWQLAERMRAAVQDSAIAHAHSCVAPVVTVSIGLAVFVRGKTLDFDDLFSAADQALYRAKEAGRNQVCGPPALDLQGGVT